MPNSSSNANKIVISENYSISKHRIIAILPFRNSGIEGYDYSVTDKFSMHCMESGFVVIERMQLEQVFKELKLELTGMLSKSDMNRIGKILNLDMIVFGTTGYGNMPSMSFGANYIGSGSVLQTESARFVDIASGEVLISIYVNEADPATGSLSEAMYLLLKNKLREIKYKLAEQK